MQLQIVVYDFKEEGTGTEHVAIATSKCVPSAKFQWHCFIIGGDILNFVSLHCTGTTGDIIIG